MAGEAKSGRLAGKVAIVTGGASGFGAGIATQFVAEGVAPYKKVRAVEIIDEIPKSPSGKILRRVLIERERTAATAR